MKWTVLLLLTALCLPLSAQKNPLPGYIVSNDNDTIYGKIDFRTPPINQMYCLFVPQDEGSTPVAYYPGEIREYRFLDNGKYYISKKIEIKGETLSVFVEYLVKGRLNLYYYEHTDLHPYFIFDEYGKDLYYITQNPPKEVTLGYVPDYRYIGVLQNYFRESGTPALNALLAKPKFTQHYMQKVTKLYNDETCGPDDPVCVVFLNEKPDKSYLQADFSVFAGVEQIKLAGRNPRPYPAVGVEVLLLNPRWNRYIGGVFDLSAALMESDAATTLLTTTIRTGLRYTYIKPRLRPSVDAGVSFVGSYLFDKLNNDRFSFAIDAGNYIGAGLEYAINKKQSVYLRFNYFTYGGIFFGLGKAEFEDEKPHIWQIRMGYSF